MNDQTTPATFSFSDTEIRTIDKDGEIWFVASGIAKSLDYRDALNMVRSLDEDEKGTHLTSTLGGQQEVTIINESGLYSAILRSKKPEAKAFKKWVTNILLPTIRKTGKFAIEEPKQIPGLRVGMTMYEYQGRAWMPLDHLTALLEIPHGNGMARVKRMSVDEEFRKNNLHKWGFWSENGGWYPTWLLARDGGLVFIISRMKINRECFPISWLASIFDQAQAAIDGPPAPALEKPAAKAIETAPAS